VVEVANPIKKAAGNVVFLDDPKRNDSVHKRNKKNGATNAERKP